LVEATAVGDGLSFGGGTGGSSSFSSVGCRFELRGSNCWRICCNEASREWLGDAVVGRAFDLGGDDGEERVNWLSGSGVIVEGSVGRQERLSLRQRTRFGWPRG